VHRRNFSLGILKISAAALLFPRQLARPLDSSNETSSIAALYKNATVIDSLCGPFFVGCAITRKLLSRKATGGGYWAVPPSVTVTASALLPTNLQFRLCPKHWR
jgi:hypothetical protein